MPEKYVVVEIQTNSDGTIGNLVTAYDSRFAAESAFHGILAAAAISDKPVHAAVLLTNEGVLRNAESYKHGEVSG